MISIKPRSLSVMFITYSPSPPLLTPQEVIYGISVGSLTLYSIFSYENSEFWLRHANGGQLPVIMQFVKVSLVFAKVFETNVSNT